MCTANVILSSNKVESTPLPPPPPPPLIDWKILYNRPKNGQFYSRMNVGNFYEIPIFFNLLSLQKVF